MATPLSMNELQALDRKVASLAHEVSEVASLLRSRYGESEELAAAAAAVCDDLSNVANQLHRRALAARNGAPPADQSRIA
jgi:NTP pyrophosphatase (non-canonical NTP hydrolase)